MEHPTDSGLQHLQAGFASLLHRPTCRLLREILGHKPCHLVGGALRDLALGKPIRDLDIVVAGDGAAVADELAARLGSRSIRLGGHRFAAYRVTRQDAPIDIWDRGAVSLHADLRRRDFTIHSFALDLHTGALHDPYSGIDDLMRKRLRTTTPEAFVDDPLRVLRLCRFAAQIGGSRIDPDTLNQARDSVQDLPGMACERIRTEIELTLSQPRAASGVELWIDLQIVPGILLDTSLSPHLRLRLQTELTRALRALEQAAAALPVTSDLTRARLALLLIQLDRSANLERAAALESLEQHGFVTKAMSRQVSRLLDAGDLPAGEAPQRWFLHRLRELWPEAVSLYVAMASERAKVEPQSGVLRQVIELATQRAEEVFDPPRLISGKDLQRHLDLEPGAQLGRLLGAIRRQQIEGAITTRAGALDLAVELLAADDKV